jgi:hypothetical protein
MDYATLLRDHVTLTSPPVPSQAPTVESTALPTPTATPTPSATLR